MGQELVQVIDQISKEKGISREMVIEAVEAALVSAAKNAVKISVGTSAVLCGSGAFAMTV